MDKPVSAKMVEITFPSMPQGAVLINAAVYVPIKDHEAAILKAKNDALEEAANLLAIDATNATSDDAEIALYKAAHTIRNLKHEG